MESATDDQGLEHSKRYGGIRDFPGVERRHRADPLRSLSPADVEATKLPRPRAIRRCDSSPFPIFIVSDPGFRISHPEFRTLSSKLRIPYCRDKL